MLLVDTSLVAELEDYRYVKFLLPLTRGCDFIHKYVISLMHIQTQLRTQSTHVYNIIMSIHYNNMPSNASYKNLLFV